MSKDYISIHAASELANKSIQTIRRAIKAKKLKYRKRKTPQGFNYSIHKASLCEAYGLQVEAEVKEEKLTEKTEELKKSVETVMESKSEKMEVDAEDFRSFASTMERMFNQHHEERQNFLRLVNTLQEKIFVMENQLNLLKAAPEKKWYQVWK